MAGLLEGQIASAIYAGFKGRLLKGNLRRALTTGDTDDNGDAVSAGYALYLCEGFTDQYTDQNRPAGAPETDLMANIFGKSLPSGIRPRKDDLIQFTQAGVVTWYQLRKASTDPAQALWTCQAFEVPAPLESE